MTRYDPATRARLRAEILDLARAGWSLARIARRPDMASLPTLTRWRKADPGFGAELIDALRRARWRAFGQFDPALAEALLARYRAGELINAIYADPAMPSRSRVRYWCATQAPFCAELGRLKAMHATERGRQRREANRWTYSEDLADRIAARVYRGESLIALTTGNPDLPSVTLVTRWRREHRDFDAKLRWAGRGGAFNQLKAKRRALYLEVIVDRIREGHSLWSLSRMADMPSRSTLVRWLKDDPVLDDAVARACDDREEILRDELVEVGVRAYPPTQRGRTRATAEISRQITRLRNRPGRAWREERWRKREGG